MRFELTFPSIWGTVVLHWLAAFWSMSRIFNLLSWQGIHHGFRWLIHLYNPIRNKRGNQIIKFRGFGLDTPQYYMRDPVDCINFVQMMGIEPMFDTISTTATSIEDISFHRYICICRKHGTRTHKPFTYQANALTSWASFLFVVKAPLLSPYPHIYWGRGEIRTLGTLSGSLVFKTSAINHSATLPLLNYKAITL